jgi:hypothetical protein
MIIFPFIFSILIGWSILKMMRFSADTLSTLGYSYGLGLSVIGFQLIFFSFLQIPWNIWIIIVPWLPLILFNIAKNKYNFKILKPKLGLFEKILVAAILSLTLFVFFESSIRPLMAYDAWSNWFLAAKAFYLYQGVDVSYIQFAGNSSPPLISVMVSNIYIFVGNINEQAGIYLFTGFYISILLVLYGELKSMTSRTNALLFTFLLASSENLIRHGGRIDVGHADIILGYFILCSTILLIKYIKQADFRHITLFALFLAPISLLKNEGIVIALVISFAAIIFSIKNKQKFLVLILFLLITSSPYILWKLFHHFYNLPDYPLFSSFDISRTFEVLINIAKELLNIRRWNLLWIAFFVFLPFALKGKQEKAIALVVLLINLAYFSTYLTTALDPIEHLRGSLDRLLLHTAPLAAFLTGLLFYRKFKNSKLLKS